MSTYNFDHVPDRRHTDSVKWDHYGERDVLPLWVADMDFAVPPAVTDALQQRIKHDIFGYTHANDNLVQALCAWTRGRYDWSINPDWLVWIPGAVPALHNALGYVAGAAAWRDGHAWLHALLDYLRGNRDLITITNTLTGLPQIKARPPEATYLYWLDLRACGIDDPVKHLEKHGLGLSDGTDFGAPGFARLNFACPRTTLETALTRLTAALS